MLVNPPKTIISWIFLALGFYGWFCYIDYPDTKLFLVMAILFSLLTWLFATNGSFYVLLRAIALAFLAVKGLQLSFLMTLLFVFLAIMSLRAANHQPAPRQTKRTPTTEIPEDLLDIVFPDDDDDEPRARSKTVYKKTKKTIKTSVPKKKDNSKGSSGILGDHWEWIAGVDDEEY